MDVISKQFASERSPVCRQIVFLAIEEKIKK